MYSKLMRRVGAVATIAGAAVALGSGAAMADSIDSASSDGGSPIAAYDINGYHGAAGFIDNTEDTVWSFCPESWPIHPTQYQGVITELSGQNGHGYYIDSPIGGAGDDYGCNTGNTAPCPPGWLSSHPAMTYQTAMREAPAATAPQAAAPVAAAAPPAAAPAPQQVAAAAAPAAQRVAAAPAQAAQAAQVAKAAPLAAAANLLDILRPVEGIANLHNLL